MLRKIIKNKKGSALVFVMILIANALVIMSSVVFISTIQNRSGASLSLTASAFQQADSGLEYILRRINHQFLVTDTISNLCSVSGGKCDISDPKVTIYFFNSSNQILSGINIIDDIEYVKVVGEASNSNNRITRSIKTTLFTLP